MSSLAIQQQGVVGFDTLKVKTMDITSIILKVSSICNLNCKYCYLFNKSDKSHLRFLNTMPHEVVVETLKRIDDFLKTSKAKSIELTFLGGEPLIVGIDFYNDFFALAKKYILSGKVKYSIQTNGTLLNLEWINLFKAHDVSIGVSLDGDENANKKSMSAYFLLSLHIQVHTPTILSLKSWEYNTSIVLFMMRHMKPIIVTIGDLGCGSVNYMIYG